MDKLGIQTFFLILHLNLEGISLQIQINRDKLNSKANIIESDFFSSITKQYDVIISNPPYIKDNEEIEDIVKNNEPHLALYAGEKGLDCYEKILIK